MPVGIPFKQTFVSKDYNAGSQNWAITQDKRGIIYVGNSLGILEYDGVEWRVIETPIGSDVFTLAVDTFGIVYAGLTDQFGYISADWSGNPVYKSLSDSVEGFFGQVFNIIPVKEDVYFVTEYDRIFKLSGKKVTEVFNTKYSFTGKLNGSLIIQKRTGGLYEVKNDTLKKIPNLDKLANKNIMNLLPYNPKGNRNRNLFITSKGEFYIYDGQQLSELKTEISPLFKKYFLYDSEKLAGNYYALILDPFGVIVINSQGKIVYTFDIESNLISQSALTLFKDMQNGLWVGTNEGLNRFEFPTPFQSLFSETGIRGGVTDIKKFNNQLYISTLGRFYQLKEKPDPANQFSANFAKRFGLNTIKEINAWTWAMLVFKNKLLLATDLGLYSIDTKNKTRHLFKNIEYTSICQSVTDENRFFLTSYDSLFSVKYNHGKLLLEKSIFIGHNGNFSTYETADSLIWINSYEQGYYKIDIKKGIENAEIKQYTTKNGLPQNNFNFMSMLNNQLLFLAKDGLYKFNSSSDSFNIDTTSSIGKTFYKKGINDIVDDGNGNIFATTLKNLSYYKKNKIGGFTKDDSTFARISDFATEKILIEDNGRIWFGGSPGLINYDPSYSFKSQNSYKTLIRSIYFGGELFFNGDWIIPRKHKPQSKTARKKRYHQIDYDFRSAKFTYSINSFHHLEYNKYQYFLEGFEKDWSKWSNKSEREYTNLPVGKYIFHIRAKNVDNYPAKEAVFYFEIIPPWYKTTWAYLGYIFGTVLFIILIVKWRSFGLKQLVSERTKELTNANLQLISAKAEAEQAVRSKSIFLANMSHEIRTPLNGILGMNHLLSGTPLSDDQKEYVDAINYSADSLHKLINEILDFSKIEAGKMEIEIIEFDLVSFMENVFKILKVSAEKKGLKISLTLDKDLPKTVKGDPHRIKQILLNFGSNAIKFTKQGEIAISLSINKIADKKIDNEAKVPLQFMVSDTGVGIKKKKHKQIFSSFSQADSSTTREYGGTGLGLSISKLLATLMGGTIEFDSNFGKGSVFWLNLSLEHNELTIEKKLLSEKQKVFINDLNKLKILVAEDNSINQKFIKRLLENNNALVEIANNGHEAVNMYKSQSYDLILMDINMPVMDGYKATELIRSFETDQGGHIPIIALTANAIKGDRETCLAADMDDYLTKPVKIDDLINIIEMNLNKN